MKSNKLLGQNFLICKRVVNDIIEAAALEPDDVILEVGPGKGILTEAILEKIPNGRLIAVEKDGRLVEFLREKFKNAPNLELVEGDILKFDFARYSLPVTRYIIVANIPYYITSRLLKNFLQNPPAGGQPSKMVLMVQKEVAERIAGNGKRNSVSPSRPSRGMITKQNSFSSQNKESILSISVKAYGEPKIVKKVPAGCFSPKPKVDSAILLINNISKDFFTKNKLDEKKFFELVRAGFSHKRKLLKSNLKIVKHRVFNNEDINDDFKKCGISEKARSEDLKLEDWGCIAKDLQFSEDIV